MLPEVSNALAGALGLTLLVRGVRLLTSPRGCASAASHWTRRRTVALSLAPTAKELSDLEPARSPVPALGQPTHRPVDHDRLDNGVRPTTTGGTS